MTRNKRPKRDLAKSMMSQREISDGIGPFECQAWLKRNESIKNNIKKRLTNKK